MRFINLFALSLFVSSLSASSLFADDEIITRAGKKYGSIKSESGLGVTLEGKKDIIPAGDIVDIRYDRKSTEPGRDFYSDARFKEASLDKSKNVRLTLLEAVDKYEMALRKIPDGPDTIYYRRNIQFRIAFLRGRAVLETRDEGRVTAVAALKAFARTHRDSWQIAQCLQMLAELQLDDKKYADAEKTYSELGQAHVPEVVKQDAKFLAAKLSMQIGNLTQAEERFKELIAKLPEDSPIMVKARIGQIECLTLAKKTDEANQKLRQMIKESKSNDLKAHAHNALGKNLFDEGKLKDARWEFLWVDTVYNQDKNEHARSLYYLWHTFSKLNESDRAQECLEALLGEQFVGTDFQRKAQSEQGRK